MNQIVRRSLLSASTVALYVFGGLAGCGATSSPTSQKPFREAASNADAASARYATTGDPGIDLQCAANHIRNAPAPFHWSFKKTATPDTNADWEADVTADVIGGTFIDSSGTRAIHGTRSDMTSWNTAVLLLTSPVPASTFALVDHSSAIAHGETEHMNSENAIHYAIDTSRDSAADASLIKSVLGARGSIKGSAWVTQDGCPVKFVLDVEQFLRDGSVQKEHYEENVTMR